MVRGNRTLTRFAAWSYAAGFAPRKWIFSHIFLLVALKTDFWFCLHREE